MCRTAITRGTGTFAPVADDRVRLSECATGDHAHGSVYDRDLRHPRGGHRLSHGWRQHSTAENSAHGKPDRRRRLEQDRVAVENLNWRMRKGAIILCGGK